MAALMLLRGEFKIYEHDLHTALNGRDPEDHAVAENVASRAAMLWRKEGWDTIRGMTQNLGIIFVESTVTFDEICKSAARAWLKLLAQRTAQVLKIGDTVRGVRDGRVVDFRNGEVQVEYRTREWLKFEDVEKT